MAHAVDSGFTKSWTIWQQGAWFVAMVALLSFGLGPVMRATGRDRRLAWLPLLIVIWFALVFLIAWQLNARFGVSYLSSYLIAAALMLILGSWKRAWWVWEDPQQWVSEAFGDRVAQIVYTAIGLFLIVVAILYA